MNRNNRKKSESAAWLLNRRAFLRRTVLAGGMAPIYAAPLPLRSAGEVESNQRMFELGMVTYNLGRNWNLDEIIEKCEKTNFRAVELRSTHEHGVEPHLSKEQRAAVRNRFEKTEVRLLCLGTACEFHSPKTEEVHRNIELSKRFIELAADVGALGIKVRPNGIPDGVPVDTTLRQIGHALQDVGRTAEKHRVEVWVEVHGRKTSHPPHMKRMMDYCRHPLVGITWNSNPTDLKDGSVRTYFELLKEHIRNVHINELFSGYPYAEFFTLLRGFGYDRYTMAEVPGAKGDPTRFMHYYRMLWEELSKPRA